MTRTDYETRASIQLHRQSLMQEAERERLWSHMQRDEPGESDAFFRTRVTVLPRRVLVRTGLWLIAVGGRLETRYADGPARS